jgi:hypothetical protein
MATKEAGARAKLATRLHQCENEHCPGWAVFNGNDLQVCDDCWRGHPDPLFDCEVTFLPEALAALDAARLEGEENLSYEEPTQYEVRSAKGFEALFEDVSKANRYANELKARLGANAWVVEKERA